MMAYRCKFEENFVIEKKNFNFSFAKKKKKLIIHKEDLKFGFVF